MPRTNTILSETATMPRPSPITDEQGDELVLLYQNGSSRNELAVRFGASRPFVNDYLRRRGVKVRSLRDACCPKLRDDAFDDAVNDEGAAYWVGFLMADGCISTYQHRPAIIIQLQRRDHDHISKFLSFVGATTQPYLVPAGKIAGEGSRCHVYSERLVDAVAKYGVVQRKTKEAKVSLLENNRHFWRGVIDGDGNLGRSRRTNSTHAPRPVVQLAGSENLTKQFEQFAKLVTGTVAKNHKAKHSWGFSVSSGCASAMISYLYTECSVALDRKWVLAHELLCEWECRPRRREVPMRQIKLPPSSVPVSTAPSPN